MRFCMVTTFYPPYHFGGDAVYIRALSRALVERGHSVDVVHCEDAYRLQAPSLPAPAEPDPGITVHRLKSRTGFISPLITQQTGRPGLKTKQLRAIFDQNFDVINFHNISLIGGPGVLAMGDAPVKLYTTHEHWLVCPMHVLWKYKSHACDSKNCIKCCLKSGVPPQLWRYTSYLHKQMKNVDMLLAPSKFTAEQHQQAAFAPPIRILRLFSSLDPGPLAPKPQRDRPLFIYVGRVLLSKGVPAMLERFARLPQYDLHVIGDGELFESLRSQYKEFTHIRFLGKLPHTDLIKQFHEATALVFPSIGPEVSPLTILEACACATPVIAQDLASSRELVESTGGGLCYHTPDQLEAALHQLATDPQHAAALGNAGRQGFLDQFTRDIHVDTYLRIIQEVQQSKGVSPAMAESLA